MALIHRICQTCGKAFMRSTTKLSRECKACERSLLLTAEQWAEWQERLAQPPQIKPRLQKLFKQP